MTPEDADLVWRLRNIRAKLFNEAADAIERLSAEKDAAEVQSTWIERLRGETGAARRGQP